MEGITSPLTDETLTYFVDCYSKGIDFYKAATKKTVSQKRLNGQYHVMSRVSLYNTIYQDWRNSILNPSHERIQNIAPEDLSKLQELLRNGPTEFKSESEYTKFIYSDPLLEKYDWRSYGNDDIFWTRVYSDNITTGSSKNWNTEHKLYINTDGYQDFIVGEFVKLCNKDGLPYHVKYAASGYRDDTVVVYSSTENLQKYIDILNEVLSKLLAATNGQQSLLPPPILSGKVGDYIGYASENNSGSYNSNRTKILYDVIMHSANLWYMSHLEHFEYICRCVCKKTFVGPDIDEAVKTITESFMNYKTTKKFPENVTIKLPSGTVNYDTTNLTETLRKNAIVILKYAPNFISNIRKNVGILSKQYGIDESFCFDEKKKQALAELSQIKK